MDIEQIQDWVQQTCLDDERVMVLIENFITNLSPNEALVFEALQEESIAELDEIQDIMDHIKNL